MELIIDKLIIVLLFFFGESVLNYLDIDTKLFYIGLLALSAYPILTYLPSLFRTRSLLILLLFVITFATFKIITDRGEGTRQLALTIMGAPVLMAALPNPTHFRRPKYLFFWRSVVTILFFAYIAEVNLAVFERLIGRNVFGWNSEVIFSIEEMGGVDYRSTSLHGHPLANALLVTTAMSFILVSPLKTKIKFSLWLIGFLAVLCFNTRSSIVGNILLLLAYLGYSITLNKRVKGKRKIAMLWSSVGIIIIGYIVVFVYGWGGRLLDMGLFDEESAQVRVNAWDLFAYYDIDKFLWGHSYNEVIAIKYSVGLYHLENFWLGYLLSCGLVFLMIYTILYIFVFKYILRKHSFFNKWFVSLSFLMIASTNNSLDSGFIYLFYFMLLCIVFDPRIFQIVVKKKYIDQSLCVKYRL